MKTSIALCTYNGTRFLREQLDSFTRQTLPPDEVVVCDDGSTDDSVRIVRQWSAEVPFPVHVVVNTSNLGYARNFHQALSLCSGDLLFPSDQDDIWHPEKLQTMTEHMSSYSSTGKTAGSSTGKTTGSSTGKTAGILYCDARMVDSAGQPMNILRSEQLQEYMYCYVPYYLSLHRDRPKLLSGCCSAIRSEVFRQIPAVGDGWSHDLWYYVFAQLVSDLAWLPKPLLDCRVHDRNTSGIQCSEEEYFQSQQRIKTFYRRSPGTWLFLQSMMAAFRKQLDLLPDCDGKKEFLRMLRRHDVHFSNRDRIARHPLLRWPLTIAEFLSGRYFHYDDSFNSAFFDLTSTQHKSSNK